MWHCTSGILDSSAGALLADAADESIHCGDAASSPQITLSSLVKYRSLNSILQLSPPIE